GAYLVRLHFAEVYDADTVGQRVFDVLLNGAPVLTNFDILAAAGAKYRGIVREFPATADASGSISIAIHSVVGAGQLNGLEVLLAPISISGVVSLQGCVRPQQSLTFTLRPQNGGSPITVTQTLGPNGSFRLPDLVGGNYTLAIKGAKWLQSVVPADVRGGSL